jgi:hypothetical protein
MSISQRHRVNRAERANFCEHRERVVAVVGAPRRQRCPAVITTAYAALPAERACGKHAQPRGVDSSFIIDSSCLRSSGLSS